MELNDALEEQGFEPFASAAVLAEHSMVREVAAGRPDAKDHEELSGFGAQILKKLEAAESVTDPKKCILCLRCIAVCPSGAKKLPEPVQEMLNQKLLPLKGIRKENELFL